MKRDRKEVYRELIEDISEGQAKMAEYNKKHNLPIINKNSKTIAEIEDIILNKYGGKKLDTAYFYGHLSDFYGPRGMIDYREMLSPCQVIFSETEEIIPDEYFYSFYWIPLKDEQKEVTEFHKELVVFITSTDGKHIYDSGIMINVIKTMEFDLKVRYDICYYAEGILVFYNEIKDKW